MEDFDEGVIRLTPEAGKCAEICSQKDRRQQIEVIVKLESKHEKVPEYVWGDGSGEASLPLLNSYTGCSMEMEEFYDKVLVPNALLGQHHCAEDGGEMKLFMSPSWRKRTPNGAVAESGIR